MTERVWRFVWYVANPNGRTADESSSNEQRRKAHAEPPPPGYDGAAATVLHRRCDSCSAGGGVGDSFLALAARKSRQRFVDRGAPEHCCRLLGQVGETLLLRSVPRKMHLVPSVHSICSRLIARLFPHTCLASFLPLTCPLQTPPAVVAL